MHPDLARALDLPVIWPEDRFHSSVLRISSSNTTLWTHYDTHDNLLAQVVGAKTVDALFRRTRTVHVRAGFEFSRGERHERSER